MMNENDDSLIGHPLVREIDSRGQIVTLLEAPHERDDIPNLISAIQDIRLICWALLNESFLETLSDDDLFAVIEALVACPTLDILRCSDMKDRSFRILCQVLERQTQQHSIRRLTNVWMVGLTLSEPNSSTLMSSFVEYLSRIPTLDKVNLLMLAPEEGASVQSSITAEFRCRGFASQSTLWTLGLYDEQISLIRDVFRCNKGRFSNLKVSGTDSSGITTKTLGALLLAESVTDQSSSLERMQVSFDLMHKDGSIHISKALERNCCLKELSILVKEEHASTFRIEPLAEMLRFNSSLEWLELSRSLLNDESAVVFAKALKNNQTLKVFDVNFSTPAGKAGITKIGFKALLEMLFVNHVLEIIPTHGLDDEGLQGRIEWYLNLNESGLRQIQLTENTGLDEFFSILEAQEDLDYVFFLLSQNTSLFSDFRLSQ